MSGITKSKWSAGTLTMEEMTFKGPYIPIKAEAALMMFDGLIAVVGGLNAEEAKANARLIAAAPKLLKACRYTIEKLKSVKGKTFPILSILQAIKEAGK